MDTGIIPVSICGIVAVNIVDPPITGIIDNSDMACPMTLEDDDVSFNGYIITVFDGRLGVFCTACILNGTAQTGYGSIPGNGPGLICITCAPAYEVCTPCTPVKSLTIKGSILFVEMRGSFVVNSVPAVRCIAAVISSIIGLD